TRNLYLQQGSMKDFRLFDISDFAMDEDFIRWVNEKKKVDNDFWDNWLHQNPGKYMAVAEARRILESIGTERRVISGTERQHEVERLMNIITGRFLKHKQKALIVTISRKWWYVAATLFLAITSTAFYFLIKHDNRPEKFA